MNLSNPFSIDTRLLYLGVWSCFECHRNGQDRGGLELHHIMGRNSASPCNSALLCKECHAGMCHSQEEEQRLFLKTMKFLKLIKYQMTSEDMYFIEKNKNRLIGKEFTEWIEKV